MEMDVDELQDFVNDAMANGWPGNTVPRTDADFPGFYGGNYRSGQWRCLDVWSGATTDAGMVVVFFKESPSWTCVYRGGILRGNRHLEQTSVEENELFGFLIEALHSPQDAVFRLRGPSEFASGDLRWRYEFSLKGDIESFIATEQIYENGTLAYERVLMGGCIGDGVSYAPEACRLWS